MLALITGVMANVGFARGSSGTLTWTTRAAMPTPRANIGLAVDSGGAVYAFGGDDATHNGLATVERYDPSSDTWIARAPMLTALRQVRPVRGTDGKIYVLGGANYPTFDSSSIVQAYDPASNTWSSKASLPVITQGAAGTLGPDGKIYVFGGYPGCCFNYLNTVFSYDTATDTWTPRASMPTPREAAGAALAADGKIYVAGGNGNGPVGQTMEAYDPIANTWVTRAPIPVGISPVSLIPASNGRLYALGDPDGTVFEYDPATDTWETATPLSSHRYGLQATVAGNGRIYVLGGREATASGAQGVFLGTNEEGSFSGSSADLSISNRASLDPVLVGETLTYTLAVSNAGPAPAGGVTLTDPLPAGASFVSATASQGSCSQTSGTVTCTLGGLDNGASTTVTLKVVPHRKGTISNSATVASATLDPDMTNNTATTAGGVLELNGGAFGEQLAVTGPVSVTSGPSPAVTLPAGGGVVSTSLASVRVSGPVSADRLQVSAQGGRAAGLLFVNTAASIANVTIGGGAVVASGISSSCHADLHAASGGATMTSLTVLGVRVKVTSGPNTTTVIPGVGTLTLNQQTLDSSGVLTVNAVHVHLDGKLGTADLILAQSKCGIDP